jgi:hypothetical protein
MNKKIDLKNRVVDIYNSNTQDDEQEIIGYLDRQMKVRFHSAHFNNNYYVFIGRPSDSARNSITISGYRKKQPGEKISVEIS